MSKNKKVQPGHYSNPAHALGLTGADVMIAGIKGMTLEEYAEYKKQKAKSKTKPKSK